MVNSLVAGEFGLRFCAGIPLKNQDGHGLGTLGAIDKSPQEITAEQTEILEDLAAVVLDELELRREAIDIQEARRFINGPAQVEGQGRGSGDACVVAICLRNEGAASMETFHYLIGQDTPPIVWWQMSLRAVIIFLYPILLYRVAPRRSFSNPSARDIVLTVILGPSLSRSLTSNDPLLPTLAVTGLLVVLYVTVTARRRILRLCPIC